MHNPDIKINNFCEIKDSKLVFHLQNGPIKDHGVNGAQIDDLIEMSKNILSYFNDKFPCRENSMAITKLDESILWCKKRTLDREKRGVEGLDKK